MEISFGKYRTSCLDAYRLMSMAKRIDDDKDDLSDEEGAKIEEALDKCGGSVTCAENYLRQVLFDNEWPLERVAKSLGMSIEQLKEATQLDLHGLQITDISFLSQLKNLKVLILDGLKISDISAIKELKNLEKLSLDDTKVTDITPLQNLKKLRYLSMNSTAVSDITALKELRDLEDLCLDFTKVSDITPLAKLKKLKNLYLAFTKVSDITPIKDHKILQLSLLGTPVKETKEELQVIFPAASILR